MRPQRFNAHFRHYPGIGSFVLADGAVNRKNWDGREGPNVATWPTLTHACPKKGCPPSQGTAALKQHAQ